jgi:hypothetical protein
MRPIRRIVAVYAAAAVLASASLACGGGDTDPVRERAVSTPT